MDRRHLLKLALAASTAYSVPRFAWSQARFDQYPFALGVASGSPRHDGMVLWTRLLLPFRTGDVTVRWELADDDGFRRLLRTGEAPALRHLGHSVHVELEGLAPDRWYFYRFMIGDAVSATGRTRSFPAPGAAATRMRIAYASCQNYTHGHYAAYRHMREESLDAVVFLGDYIYESGASKDAVRGHSLRRLRNLDDYRERYAVYRSDADLQAMHAACPWLVTWDDHEVENNYAALSGEGSAEKFALLRAAAYQAYYEHMPLRASTLMAGMEGLYRGAELRIYDRAAFGRLAVIHTLDGRQYRDTQACVRGGVVNAAQCESLRSADRTMLGAAQEAWLAHSLAKDGKERAATWNVIGQQTLFGKRDFFSGADEGYSVDAWDGYPAARQRLIDDVRRAKLDNFVMLGGDVHANWVGHIKADFDRPDSATLGVEFCGTSISSRSGNDQRQTQLLRENPHFVFASAERRGYGVVELSPRRLVTTLRVVQDVTRADSAIETQASFAVEAGSAKIERA